VIETPRGGRNKLAYDEDLGIFRLQKVLPEGMSFPYDFGFVPSTIADDGDPIDALVLMDEPGTTGCLVECRLIGVILGEQGTKRDRCRNDRLVAVAIPSHTHGDLDPLSDLNRSRGWSRRARETGNNTSGAHDDRPPFHDPCPASQLHSGYLIVTVERRMERPDWAAPAGMQLAGFGTSTIGGSHGRH
jgi:hypothetical protein